MEKYIFLCTVCILIPMGATTETLQNNDLCAIGVESDEGSSVEIGIIGQGQNFGTSEKLKLGSMIKIVKVYADRPGCAGEGSECPPEPRPTESAAIQDIKFSKEIIKTGKVSLVLYAKTKTTAKVLLQCSSDGKVKYSKTTLKLLPNKNRKISIKFPVF